VAGNCPSLFARNPAAPGAAGIEKEIVGHAIEISQGIRDRPGGAFVEFEKDLLQNILGLVRRSPSRSKETVQHVPICLEHSREAADRLIGRRMNLDYLQRR